VVLRSGLSSAREWVPTCECCELNELYCACVLSQVAKKEAKLNGMLECRKRLPLAQREQLIARTLADYREGNPLYAPAQRSASVPPNFGKGMWEAKRGWDLEKPADDRLPPELDPEEMMALARSASANALAQRLSTGRRLVPLA
jgi:hypothetical protein